MKDKKYTFPFSLETTTVGKKWPINNAGNGISILKFPANSVYFNISDCVIKKQDMSEGNIITKLLDDVKIKNSYNENEFRLEGEFRYNQQTIDEIVKNYEQIYIAKIPFRPNHIKDGGEIKKMKNELSQNSYNCETNEDGEDQVNNLILNNENKFDNPKPVGLIKLLIKATTYENDNAIILDFFAGSGTTGQAVLEQNKEDGGNRQFILVQLDEDVEGIQKEFCEKNKLDKNLASITYERLKRTMTGKASDGKPFAWSEKNEKLGDNLLVCKVGSCANFDEKVFENIDETLYGLEKFEKPIDKINWVCDNFEFTQKRLYKKKIQDGKEIEDFEVASEGGFTETEIEEAKKKAEEDNKQY